MNESVKKDLPNDVYLCKIMLECVIHSSFPSTGRKSRHLCNRLQILSDPGALWTKIGHKYQAKAAFP